MLVGSEDTAPSYVAGEDAPPASCVSSSLADDLLREAIEATLRAEPSTRGDRMQELLTGIEAFMKEHPEERPWTFTAHTGTDGSRIFRGGTGRSIVVDPDGGVWRARSYEDFDTAYDLSNNECRIAGLTPLYKDMRRCELA